MKRTLATILAVLAFSLPAAAGTLNANFNVTANLMHTPGCTSFSANPIDFGSLSGNAGQLAATEAHGQISWVCDTPNWTIALSPGNAGAQNTAPDGRKMVGPGGAQLGYNIYVSQIWGGQCDNWTHDSTDVWGDNTGGTVVSGPYTSPQDDASTQFTCANIPAQAYPGDGAYSDTITATITF